jgi:hypothetical protein
MVITGTATRLGGRIDTMAYLDAFLPEDGQSRDITSEYEHRHYIDTQKFTPGLVAPIIGEMGRKLSRHPLLTMLEGVRFTGRKPRLRAASMCWPQAGSLHLPQICRPRQR